MRRRITLIGQLERRKCQCLDRFFKRRLVHYNRACSWTIEIKNGPERMAGSPGHPHKSVLHRPNHIYHRERIKRQTIECGARKTASSPPNVKPHTRRKLR